MISVDEEKVNFTLDLFANANVSLHCQSLLVLIEAREIYIFAAFVDRRRICKLCVRTRRDIVVLFRTIYEILVVGITSLRIATT